MSQTVKTIFDSINRDAFRRVIHDIENGVTFENKPVTFNMSSLFDRHSCGTAACILGYLNLQFNENIKETRYTDDSYPMVNYVFRLNHTFVNERNCLLILVEILTFIYLGKFSRHGINASEHTALCFLKDFVERFTYENYITSRCDGILDFLHTFRVKEINDKEIGGLD